MSRIRKFNEKSNESIILNSDNEYISKVIVEYNGGMFYLKDTENENQIILDEKMIKEFRIWSNKLF